MISDIDQRDGAKRRGAVLSMITRLKQICNHPALYLKDGSEIEGRSSKVNRLSELIEVFLSKNDKALVFTQFAQMGHLLQPYLEKKFGIPILFLHGSLSKEKRLEAVDTFQNEDSHKIFLLSLKAGGFGLNLTAANQVIHLDQWWNPATHEQATDRAYRIGQTSPVQVRKFLCKGTLEERIFELLERKRALSENIVQSTTSMITELSTNELKKLVSLTSERL